MDITILFILFILWCGPYIFSKIKKLFNNKILIFDKSF